MVPMKEAFAGTMAGITGTVLGYPLDAIKTRMQAKQLTSQWTAARQILKEGGVIGFYKGMLAPIVSLTILNTLNFSSYARFKRILDVPENAAFDLKITFSAAMVGPLASTISTPFELLKTQVQMNRAVQNSGGTWRCAQQILKNYGIRALYRGHLVNTSREMVFLSTYFTCYENVKSTMSRHLPITVAVPVAGGFSGSVGWVISFPLDCIKCIIQGSPMGAVEGERPTALTIAKKLLREKGFRGLYNGVTPSVLRAFLVSSSRFSAYEFALEILQSSSI